MKDLQEATDNICRLKGNLVGVECTLNALLSMLPAPQRARVLNEFGREAEAARVTLLNSATVGESVLDGFETYIQRVLSRFPG